MNNDKSEILYCLKGLSCLAVIVTHSLTFAISGIDDIFVKLCSFATPCFCFISGYYSYNVSLNKIKTRFKKILIFGIYCFAFYALIESLISIKFFAKDFSIGINHLSSILSLKNVFASLVLGSLPNIWKPGWYVIGMAWTYLFWIIVIKAKKEKEVLKYTPIIFAIGTAFIIVSNNYLGEVGYFSFIGRSLPWFLEGIAIRHKIENNSFAVNNVSALLFGIVGYVISISSQLLGLGFNLDYLGTVIYSFIFILLFLNINTINNKFLYNLGKNYSDKIYMYHMAVIMVISKIISPNLYNSIYSIKILYIVLCVIMTILFVFVLSKMKPKHNTSND